MSVPGSPWDERRPEHARTPGPRQPERLGAGEPAGRRLLLNRALQELQNQYLAHQARAQDPLGGLPQPLLDRALDGDAPGLTALSEHAVEVPKERVDHGRLLLVDAVGLEAVDQLERQPDPDLPRHLVALDHGDIEERQLHKNRPRYRRRAFAVPRALLSRRERRRHPGYEAGTHDRYEQSLHDLKSGDSRGWQWRSAHPSRRSHGHLRRARCAQWR